MKLRSRLVDKTSSKLLISNEVYQVDCLNIFSLLDFVAAKYSSITLPMRGLDRSEIGSSIVGL